MVKRDLLTKYLWPFVRFFLVWFAYAFGLNWLAVTGCQLGNSRLSGGERGTIWTITLIIGFYCSLKYWANLKKSKQGP